MLTCRLHGRLLRVGLVVAVLSVPVLACWISPPDVVVEASRNGDFFVRKLNPEKSIEVRQASDLALVWSVHLANYDPLFSKIVLSDDGSTLVHVRGNHQVHQTEDVAVEVWRQDGTMWSWRVRDFRDDLPESEYRDSASPRHVWHDGVSVIYPDRILVKLGADQGAIVWCAKPRIDFAARPSAHVKVRNWHADSD